MKKKFWHSFVFFFFFVLSIALVLTREDSDEFQWKVLREIFHQKFPRCKSYYIVVKNNNSEDVLEAIDIFPTVSIINQDRLLANEGNKIK